MTHRKSQRIPKKDRFATAPSPSQKMRQHPRPPLVGHPPSYFQNTRMGWNPRTPSLQNSKPPKKDGKHQAPPSPKPPNIQITKKTKNQRITETIHPKSAKTAAGRRKFLPQKFQLLTHISLPRHRPPREKTRFSNSPKGMEKLTIPSSHFSRDRPQGRNPNYPDPFFKKMAQSLLTCHFSSKEKGSTSQQTSRLLSPTPKERESHQPETKVRVHCIFPRLSKESVITLTDLSQSEGVFSPTPIQREGCHSGSQLPQGVGSYSH